ncbi:hypothetical protein, partial [Pseudomonas sp. DP16D-R1]
YRKKLITDIEIPFYIYSGKILQAHQAGLGLGVLIKDPTGGDELKNVRLVSNWKSDHDILNTMSSGHISRCDLPSPCAEQSLCKIFFYHSY